MWHNLDAWFSAVTYACGGKIVDDKAIGMYMIPRNAWRGKWNINSISAGSAGCCGVVEWQKTC